MAHDRYPERHAAAHHFGRRWAALWAPSTGLPIPGYRVRCSCCGGERLARATRPAGPENASFQRRLLLPSVFGDGGKLARITEAEAR